MTASPELVGELRAQVLLLEHDLRTRVEGQPDVLAWWQDEHRRATEANRTATSWVAWRDDRVTQAAVAWVLTSVFIRFCEDNALLDLVWIAGPPERRQEALNAQLAYFRTHPTDTDREWLLQAIDHLATTPATKSLVESHTMLWAVSPSGQAVTKLFDFWRERAEDGALRRDFTDPELSTRFLGDLYQDLSEHAKKTYALLQTPEFVEEFILDQTLEPALKERPLEGFKLIDPACGSGHFLLGAFQRLLDRWERYAPALEPRLRVQNALDAVWGVDLNAFAVAIAQFRLTLAAIQAFGERSLEHAPGLIYHVLAGDSLWFSHEQEALIEAQENDFAYSNEHKNALIEALTRGQYDAVVANPPYITVKDKALNAGYRGRYNYLKGTYALTVPFMELLFKLATPQVRDRPAGWVGQITSNSFMKREFGAPIIEKFLVVRDLVHVIDTSGAYIPGHGTPTVIIVGRNRTPSTETVRTVLGIRGEPGRPSDPTKGIVWSAIRNHIGEPGYQDMWVTVADLDRAALRQHPWSLAGGGASSLVHALDQAGTDLSRAVVTIGYSGQTNADGVFVAPRKALARHRVEQDLQRRFVIGEELRDHALFDGDWAIFPYSIGGLADLEEWPKAYQWMWRTRTVTWSRSTFAEGTYREAGRTWWEWHQISLARVLQPYAVSWAFVSTHNHFVLVRGEHLFNRSAPFFQLDKGASEVDHLALLGVLNSSTACFWLKQNSHNKGRPGAEAAGADEAWEHRFEFTGTTLQDFPLPATLPLKRGTHLDELARRSSEVSPEAVCARDVPAADMLGSAAAEWAKVRGRMVAVQEELDWETYRLYGILDEDLTYQGADLPEIAPAERAFAIALARRVDAGDEQTSWFSHWNHQFNPITEIPSHWPAMYRDLVQRRLDLLASDRFVRLLERPEYKRRWASEPWAVRQERAVREWLLDRLEDRAYWFDRQGRPTPQSISQLADRVARDADLVSVIALWEGRPDVPLVDSLTRLLTDEAVPYLAAYRLKESGMRKHEAWEETWALQRQEDAGILRQAQGSGRQAQGSQQGAGTLRQAQGAGVIPVPPKYTSADFRKQSWWQARGKLDVPKERFTLYPDVGRSTDPTLLLGWAGWDHAQQALALATIISARESEGAADAVLVPLVAGLTELLPWVEQWHSEVDPAYGMSMAAFFREELATRAQQVKNSLDQLRQWRPAAKTRGRKARP